MIPVTIKTAEGLLFNKAICAQYEWAQYHNMVDWFKTYATSLLPSVERAVIDYSDNNDIDENNQDNVKSYHELMDKFAILNFYVKRVL